MNPLLITGLTELAKGFSKSLTDNMSKQASLITLLFALHQLIASVAVDITTHWEVPEYYIEYGLWGIVFSFFILVPEQWLKTRMNVLREITGRK